MRAAGKFGAGTALSRVLGVFRDMLKAYLFGTGTAADAFTVAFRIPNMLRAFLAEGTLSASFVPVFNDYLVTGRRKESWEVARNAFGILAVVLLVVSILGVLLAIVGPPFRLLYLTLGYDLLPALRTSRGKAERIALLARHSVLALLMILPLWVVIWFAAPLIQKTFLSDQYAMSGQLILAALIAGTIKGFSGWDF